MSKSFDADTKTIGAILGNFERHVVVVPRFQRGFSWEKIHVLAFWDDILAFSSEYQMSPKSATYFLGPIVVQDTEDEIVILDGQQRLATATILLAAIRDTARTLNFALGTPGTDFARDVQRTLIEKEEADPPYSLKMGELDNDFFQKTVQSDPPKATETKLRSQELIKAATKNLRACIEKLIEGQSPQQSLKLLKQVYDCLTKGVTVIAINVESEDDAYSIFETLNDRGLRLSVPDLLLNLLMRRAVGEAERKKIRHKWDYMLEHMGRRDISRFLRHMWLANYGDLKNRGLYIEIKEHLKSGKDENISSVDFADRCAGDCDAYISLLDQKNIPSKSVADVAGVIKYLGVTSALPLLLSGIQCLSENDFVKLASATAALVVRYSLIANLNPNSLETAFYEAAREIREKSLAKLVSTKCLQAATTIIKRLNPIDAIVLETAKEANLERASALWLCTQIANYKQSSTKEIALSQANLEHIYPQNSVVTDWPNKSDMDQLVWRLGNLTILGEKLNRDAGNKSFTVKSGNYYKKSEIAITTDILQYNTWTPIEVEKRTHEMAKLINAVFPGP